MRTPFLFLLLLLVPSLAGKEKKPVGEVIDRESLLKVRSFCIDVTKLGEQEAADVLRFVNEESGQKKLLSKLPWELVVDCSQADAVARFAFQETMGLARAGGGPLAGPPTNVPEPIFRAWLFVFTKASEGLVYQTVGQATRMYRDRALMSPVSTLAKDLKTLSGTK